MKTKQLMDMMRHISPRYTEEAAARAAAAKPRFSLMGAAGVLAGLAMCTAVIGGTIYASRQNQSVETAMNSAESRQTATESATPEIAENIIAAIQTSTSAVDKMTEETTGFTDRNAETTTITTEPVIFPPDFTSAAETNETESANTTASTSLLPYRFSEAQTITIVTTETRSTIQNDMLSYMQSVGADEIIYAEVSAYPPSKTVTLSDAQICQMLTLLREVKLYEEDNSYGEYGGQYIGISIKLKDGQKVNLGTMSPFFVVDRTGYKANYDVCQKLNQFANSVIYEEPEQSEYADLTASIKTLTADGCIILFENHSTQTAATCGLWYRIYHAEDGTPCDDVPETFDEIAQEIPAGGTAELPINWTEHYGKLTSGEYYVLLAARDKNGETLRVDFILD